jgi:hypothetical protein
MENIEDLVVVFGLGWKVLGHATIPGEQPEANL